MSKEEYESFSPDKGYAEEKCYKAFKMLLAGRDVRVNEEERYVLFDTEMGGFDIGLVYNDDTFIGTGYSFAGLTSTFNNLDEKYLDDQYATFCFSQALKPTRLRG